MNTQDRTDRTPSAHDSSAAGYGVKGILRAMAKEIRNQLEARGAIPKGRSWEQAPASSRRIYLREAKSIYRAAHAAKGR